MAGDYVLSIASMMIARLENDDVTMVLSAVSTILYYRFRFREDARIQYQDLWMNRGIKI